MSAFNYSRTVKTVTRMIARYGSPATFTREEVDPESYDPETGSAAAVTTEWATKGVKLDYENSEIDGTLILASDQRVYSTPVAGLEPIAGDKVSIGGEAWRVVRSKTIKPALMAVLLDVQVRRG